MPEPKVGANVLYTAVKGDPPQHAVITAVGVDDDNDEHPTKLTDCWLAVFPAGAAPVATPEPVAYDADGKPGTWRWETDTKPKTARTTKTAGDADKGAGA